MRQLTDRSQIDTSQHPGCRDTYRQLCARNSGYVSESLQEKIRTTRILIAGCGIGSTFAEAALRMGFGSLTLADGDTVDISNLNRQAYSQADVSQPKTSALANRLKAIHPEVQVTEHSWISLDNAAALVAGCDLIFDTVDFLDIVAITAIHDEAHRQRKPLISAVSAGWGAAAIYFPPQPADDSDVCGFRRLFGLPEHGSVAGASYVKHFRHFIERIAEHLDPAVVQAMAAALAVTEDGKPCPAPQLSAGSFAVASLAVTIAVRILNGDPVLAAPQMMMVNIGAICSGGASNPIRL